MKALIYELKNYLLLILLSITFISSIIGQNKGSKNNPKESSSKSDTVVIDTTASGNRMVKKILKKGSESVSKNRKQLLGTDSKKINAKQFLGYQLGIQTKGKKNNKEKEFKSGSKQIKTQTPQNLPQQDTVIIDSLENRIVHDSNKELKSTANVSNDNKTIKSENSSQKSSELSKGEKINQNINESKKTTINSSNKLKTDLVDQTDISIKKPNLELKSPQLKKDNLKLNKSNLNIKSKVQQEQLTQKDLIEKNKKSLTGSLDQLEKKTKISQNIDSKNIEKNINDNKDKVSKDVKTERIKVEKDFDKEKKDIGVKKDNIEKKVNTISNKGVEGNAKDLKAVKVIEAKKQNIESIKDKGVEGNVRDLKVVKDAESKKQNVEGKVESLKSDDIEGVVGENETANEILKHKDTDMNKMMGGKDAKKEQEKLTQDGARKEGLSEVDNKRNEYLKAIKESKFYKSQAKVREKVYKKRPDYKEFTFKDRPSFWERFNFSGLITLDKNLINNISIAPTYNIEAFPKFSIGVGPSFQYNHAKDAEIKAAIGVNVNVKYEIIKDKVYLRAENNSFAPNVSYIKAENTIEQNWKHSQMIGAGASLKGLFNIPLSASLVYNISQAFKSNQQPKQFNFRVGIEF